jgi:predicted CoA-substrate-specific enzyme activase
LNREKILAGLDVGHVNTKVVIIKGQEILGYCTTPSGFDVVAAAQEALSEALDRVRISRGELAGMVATGIFRDVIYDVSTLNVTKTVPEYVADAKGALFLNKNSRTVIDIGGNICKAIRYDQNGNVLDVINNDKCADGLGIFYTSVARALGLSEQEMSELALKSTNDIPITIQCTVSAESEAVDLMCQGIDIADIASAVLKFITERVAAMCTYIPPAKETVVAGSLGNSRALIKHLSSSMKQDVSALDIPEYVGAVGAVVTSYEG